MSILGKIFKGRRGLADLSLEEVRLEEKRLEIRENQHLHQIEKYDKLREEVFHQGAKTKSPARRRIYARRFGEYCQRIGMIERELTRVVKELMTLGRVRSILERRRQAPVRNVLERISEEDLARLTALLEDDKVTEEVYLQKLDALLGVVNDPAYEAAEIGTEGMEVLRTWEQMDEGELEFGEALKEATRRERPGGAKEAREREEERGQAEPA
jgi:AraC-like DNA-binding protein